MVVAILSEGAGDAVHADWSIVLFVMLAVWCSLCFGRLVEVLEVALCGAGTTDVL